MTALCVIIIMSHPVVHHIYILVHALDNHSWVFIPWTPITAIHVTPHGGSVVIRRWQRFAYSPPDAFNLCNPDDWPHWRRRFQQFREASGLAEAMASNWSAPSSTVWDKKQKLFSHPLTQHRTIAGTTTAYSENLTSSSKSEKTWSMSAQFNRRNQQSGELAEQYIMALYCLAENCNYGDFKDEMIRDHLVVGIRDTALS